MIKQIVIATLFSILVVTGAETTNLGTSSVSLAVKDIAKSRAFYEKLGFTLVNPPAGVTWPRYQENWVILRNGEAVVGLFQGMFEKNTLTFNPTDVRSVQSALKEKGMTFTLEAKPGKGPAFAMLTDPDGNPVLLDQHD